MSRRYSTRSRIAEALARRRQDHLYNRDWWSSVQVSSFHEHPVIWKLNAPRPQLRCLLQFILYHIQYGEPATASHLFTESVERQSMHGR